jgi:hypothetical protein
MSISLVEGRYTYLHEYQGVLIEGITMNNEARIAEIDKAFRIIRVIEAIPVVTLAFILQARFASEDSVLVPFLKSGVLANALLIVCLIVLACTMYKMVVLVIERRRLVKGQKT